MQIFQNFAIFSLKYCHRAIQNGGRGADGGGKLTPLDPPLKRDNRLPPDLKKTHAALVCRFCLLVVTVQNLNIGATILLTNPGRRHRPLCPIRSCSWPSHRLNNGRSKSPCRCMLHLSIASCHYPSQTLIRVRQTQHRCNKPFR